MNLSSLLLTLIIFIAIIIAIHLPLLICANFLKRTLRSNDEKQILLKTGAKFTTPPEYWKLFWISLSIQELAYFIIFPIIYFSIYKYKGHHNLIVLFDMFLWIGVFCVVFLFTYFEHSKDYFYLSLDEIKYKLGHKEEAILFSNIISIACKRKQIIFTLTKNKTCRVKCICISRFKDKDRLMQLFEELSVIVDQRAI
ncbi:MAG: hypothetical protein ACYST2_04890 [Planctomycetota bacterium]|jgi:hypothetical protein